MADDGKRLDELSFTTKQDVGEALLDWMNDFERAARDAEGVPSIDTIEAGLVELDARIRKISSCAVRQVSDTR